eukprot:TRINITY_DN5796_c0_g1_i1.p1 TRINITY_DN5796_c0_g1~~TRINITY_DN5796_c0_g1_i1.p1  ORF type:complete len:141 (-),score=30.77 TRINITY_DN5796_c0_g1_i1:37-459(-)
MEYLLLLNKYGGRSFNDLNQYPVFPWILRNYSNEQLDLASKESYRPLYKTIAGISKRKRNFANNKLIESAEELDSKYQIGFHYLPGRSVMDYMQRLEPFASALIKFDNGHDLAQRMFHFIEQTWKPVSYTHLTLPTTPYV